LRSQVCCSRLVNNAGVGFGRDRKQRELSADGFELSQEIYCEAAEMPGKRALVG